MCCLLCCITSPATAGRWVRCRGTLRRSTGRAARGWRRSLPPLPVQYADYTLWQQAVLGDEGRCSSALSRQLAFWKAALADLPEQIELPGDRARPAVSSHRGGRVALTIDAGSAPGACRRWRGATGASLFMVLQAGLAGLLTRLGAGADIAIGSPIAGRTDAALDDLIGFFVNTLVLRTDTSGNPSFKELIGRVRARQPCGLWPCRAAVRAAGGGAQSGAVAVAASAVPGDAGVRGGEPGGGVLELPGLAVAAAADRDRRAPSSTCRWG